MMVILSNGCIGLVCGACPTITKDKSGLGIYKKHKIYRYKIELIHPLYFIFSPSPALFFESIARLSCYLLLGLNR